MQPAGAALGDGQVLQDLGLQRRAQSLGLSDPVLLGRRLEFRERSDADIII